MSSTPPDLRELLSNLPKKIHLSVTIDLENIKNFRSTHEVKYLNCKFGFKNNNRSTSFKDMVEIYIEHACGKEALELFQSLPTAEFEKIICMKDNHD